MKQGDGTTYGILTDITKCIGCWKCVDACSDTYNLDNEIPKRTDLGDGLSDTRWTTIIDQPGQHYVRKFCRHCAEPACASACIVGALRKTPEGPVVYDRGKCIGCRYCMMACPYGIPRYEWSSPVPYVKKCIMCYDRIKAGKQPACTEACPEDATIFGTRTDLIEEAERRIKAEPEKYLPGVYGKDEVGGTCVLYVSNIDLGFLGLKPDMGVKPMPALTRPAMKSVPFVGPGVFIGMMGISWIIGRRMSLAEGKVPEGETEEKSE